MSDKVLAPLSDYTNCKNYKEKEVKELKMWHEARKQERKLKGIMIDHKRRAERRQQFYENARRDPAQFMQIHGQNCRIHLDVTGENDQAQLRTWQGDKSVTIDRFDVRSHLDWIPSYDSKKAKCEVAENETLEGRRSNYDRYRILVANDFLQIAEEKFLKEIFVEERFGAQSHSLVKSEQEKKKHSADSKAAIAFDYGGSSARVKEREKKPEQPQNDSDEGESSDSDVDLDVNIDLTELESNDFKEINKYSLKYGIQSGDFMKYVWEDREEADHMREQKAADLEKAALSGKRSRRERKLIKDARLREMRSQGLRLTFIQKPDKPMTQLQDSDSSSSDSNSDGDQEKVEYIHEFGGSQSPSSKKKIAGEINSDASANSDSPMSKSGSETEPIVFSVEPPPSDFVVPPRSPSPIQRLSPPRRRYPSRSRSRSVDRYRRSRSWNKDRASRSSYRNRSRSRSRRRMSRSNSRHRYSRDRRSRSKSYERRRSRSRSRQQRSRSRGNYSRMKHSRSRTRSRSRDRRHSPRHKELKPLKKLNNSKIKIELTKTVATSGNVVIPSPIVETLKAPKPDGNGGSVTRSRSRSQSRPKSVSSSCSSRSGSTRAVSLLSIHSSMSEDEREGKEVENRRRQRKMSMKKIKSVSSNKKKSIRHSREPVTPNNNKPSSSSTTIASSGKSQMTTNASTIRERLMHKTQMRLKQQFSADKRDQLEKQEQKEKEERARSEELREMALDMRRRERERRHKDREINPSKYASKSPSPPKRKSRSRSPRRRRSPLISDRHNRN